jgi:hypothetical protein
MTFVSCLVLTCWSNTGHSCHVLLNLLFIRGSFCLCIGVICLFRLYALRHINMSTSCIMNSLGTSVFPLCLFTFVFGIYVWWFPTPGSWSSLLWHSWSWIANFMYRLAFKDECCSVCICVHSSPVVTAAKVWSWPSYTWQSTLQQLSTYNLVLHM